MIGFLVLLVLLLLAVKAVRFIVSDARRQATEYARREANPAAAGATDELTAFGFTWTALDDHQLARYISDVSPS